MSAKTHRRKCKEYHHRARQMGGSTTVPAGPSAEILAEMARTMSYTAIATLLGTSHTYVTGIIRGRIKRIAPKRAAKIQAVAFKRPQNSCHVDAIPGRRRLQAMNAMGYSSGRLAEEIPGYSLGAIKDLMAGRTPVIEAQHDQLIRAAFARLSMVLPVATNKYEAGGISRARNNAAAKGWLPPLAWDDIDNLDEKPKVGRNPKKYRRDELLEEWDHLSRAGYSMEQAAARLGLTADAIEAAVYRHSKEGAA